MKTEIGIEQEKRFPEAVREIPGEFLEGVAGNASLAIFRRGEDRYAWSPEGYRGIPDDMRFEVSALDPLIAASGSWAGGAFGFYTAYCFNPRVFLTFGKSFEDAYEVFVDTFEDYLKIEDFEEKDYPDHSSFSSNGVPVDTELVQGFELELVELRF